MEAGFRPIVTIRAPDGSRKPLYRLQPKQNEAYSLTPLDRAPAEPYPKHIGYGGAAGGGKSYLARAVACAAALRWPGSTGIIFRRTRAEVKDNHAQKFMGEVPRRLPDGTKLWSWNGTDMVATFKNGSRIQFGYLKAFEDVFRYQGQEYDYMVFEEATHYSWDTVRWLTGNRLRATVDAARPFVLYPSNPGNIGHHWYKRLFITRTYNPELNEDPADYAFVQAQVQDNQVLMDRDPTYWKELQTLPEPFRSWLMLGDWEAGLGLAFTMLRAEKHFVDPFVPPKHWPIYGSFDWGYEHPFSFGWWTVTEDGRAIKGDTLTGRHQVPGEICDSIKAAMDRRGVDWRRLKYVTAGHDCWADRKARGEDVPTIAEAFAEQGISLVQANISRVAGLNNMRLYFQWEGVNDDGTDGQPAALFMRTDGNEACYHQLESIPTDPDNPEDALKSHADMFGQGGDDMYDETRYFLASRPPPAKSRFLSTPMDPWSKQTLMHEREQKMRGRMPKSMSAARRVDHPEFGEMV